MSAPDKEVGEKIPVLKHSPGSKKKQYEFRHSNTDSDSEGSEDSSPPSVVSGNKASDSVSIANSQVTGSQKQTPVKGRKSRKSRSRRNEWEIVEGLKDGQRCEHKPEKYQGFLSKWKRWPMKGWHKRYFILEKGFLKYGKSPSDIQKGKLSGVIDIGLSVLAFKRHRQRIDIDAEELVYHIKVKRMFDQWLAQLRHHRLYRQHEIAYGSKESPRLTEISSPIEQLPAMPTSMNLPEKVRDSSLQRELSRHPSLKGQDRVATWLLDTQGWDHCNKGLSTAQNLLYELNKDLEQIRELPLNSDCAFDLTEMDTNDKKKNKSFVGRSSKRKDHKRNASLQSEPVSPRVGIKTPPISQPPTPQVNDAAPTFDMTDLLPSSASNPNLASNFDRQRPTSEPLQIPSGHEQRIETLKLRECFLTKATKVHECLQSLLHSLSTERDRLRNSITMNSMSGNASSTVVSLKQTLADVCQQNKSLKARLSQIHADSSLSDLHLSSPPSSPTEKRRLLANQSEEVILYQTITGTQTLTSQKFDEPDVSMIPGLATSLSAESCSMSVYFDAVEENNMSLSDSSSEHSDEEASDVTDEESAIQSASEENILSNFQTGRRSKLPVPKPDGGDVSLWNLLFKNIGKDLTKISMPVTLNEPLSMLQRLCEEVEYSELLDKANECEDPYERMIFVAAFAVSNYASSCYRVGHKPFNPVLGETYENIREDKGWRFIAEQVSHHPPISASYCDSKSFKLWQDVQIKTKFWGKSMEIQPIGLVNVQLPQHKDHYKWNKVTTCVHNILGGQRWVDQYGEMTIHNAAICCKLTFTKASHYHQSDKRHEVYGTITSPEGKVIHHLFGRWNEALYCGHAPSARCIWRPGAMPEDYEMYYGFSRYAMELNEILPDEALQLPQTDSRFRPDQRLLEEGNIAEAEKAKARVETIQRDARKRREGLKEEYKPKWFRKEKLNGKDTYVYDYKYWDVRKDPSFEKTVLPQLW